MEKIILTLSDNEKVGDIRIKLTAGTYMAPDNSTKISDFSDAYIEWGNDIFNYIVSDTEYHAELETITDSCTGEETILYGSGIITIGVPDYTNKVEIYNVNCDFEISSTTTNTPFLIMSGSGDVTNDFTNTTFKSINLGTIKPKEAFTITSSTLKHLKMGYIPDMVIRNCPLLEVYDSVKSNLTLDNTGIKELQLNSNSNLIVRNNSSLKKITMNECTNITMENNNTLELRAYRSDYTSTDNITHLFIDRDISDTLNTSNVTSIELLNVDIDISFIPPTAETIIIESCSITGNTFTTTAKTISMTNTYQTNIENFISTEAETLKIIDIGIITANISSSSLTYLDLSNNNIENLTLDAPNLSYINLKNNNLAQIPTGTFTSCTELDITGNSLTQIPDFTGFPNINKVDLRYNNITDCVDFPSFTELNNLIEVYLNGIFLKGYIPDLSHHIDITTYMFDSDKVSYTGLVELIDTEQEVTFLNIDWKEMTDLRCFSIDNISTSVNNITIEWSEK